MYDNFPPEMGNSRVSSSYRNDQERECEQGLFLTFTEDNYTEREYLVIQIADDFQSVTVKKDQCGRADTVLNLVK